MKEPERIPLDPSTPRPKKVEKIPLPSIEQEQNGFWKFVSDHKKSRANWLNQQNDEDNKKGD